MVQLVEPSWELEQADRETRGHMSVYYLEVRADEGCHRVVLKASPDDEPHGISTEVRLVTVLDHQTEIPVPTVVGAVDDHAAVPTPFFVMTSAPGTAHSYEATRRVSDAVLTEVAYQTGRYLAELHGLPVRNRFGVVSYNRPSPPAGSRPAVQADRFDVSDGEPAWSAFLWETTKPELESLQDTRFAELGSRIERTLHQQIDRLDDTLPAVIGRIDHGLHNLTIDPETGRIESLIDWEFALAVTPGYDLKTVEWVLSGAVLTPLDDATDRRELVREAMAEGYNGVAAYPAAELRQAGRLYELLAVLRAMNHLESGVAKIPAGSEDTVAPWLRDEANRLLE